MAMLKRFFPGSLLGQMILLMGVALFVAQLVNFAFLLNGQQRLSLAQTEQPAVNFFAEVAAQVSAAESAEEQDLLLGRRGKRRFRLFTLDRESLVGRMTVRRDDRLETRLRSALSTAGVMPLAVNAARDVDLSAFEARGERRRARDNGRWQTVLLSAQLSDGRWLNGRLAAPRPDPWLLGRLILATLALYILVLGAVLWIASRLTRPIKDLARAAESFGGRNEAPEVQPRGPSDVRRAIEEFNAMSRRVVGLLDEKDRMLGAIGHDLRTPLASLRIRAEAMEPEVERDAIVRTIQEMSETLEDILVLARTGRAREPRRRMDVSALADAVAEEFHALGADVTFEDSPRVPLEVQPNLLRRAIRNLVDNAVSYGTRARIAVAQTAGGAVIRVDDDGAGIPEDSIDAAIESFTRLEGSRSRETGGAGLGLAIARAVAEAHGGALRLENRPEGGLRASLMLKS